MATGMSRANARQTKTHERFYTLYKNGERRLVNKIKRVARHLRRYPNDTQAQQVIRNCMSSFALKTARQEAPHLAEIINSAR